MRASAGQVVFGPFRLDTEAPRLLRDGVELDLRPQALYALQALVQSSGRCLSYEEMIGAAWNGTSVSRHTVAVTVGEVKKVLREFGAWINYHPRLGYRLDIPRSEDLIRSGWHYWRRHTREGFEKALGCFEQAARNSSTDFRAWEGISRCYLMLGTFAMRPPREMHRRFLEAHAKAVELSGMTAELRGDYAQSLHVFELRLEEAESEFRRAQQENPHSAGTYIRIAILYAATGRFEEALDAIESAYREDGLWPVLPAAEIMVRCCRGEYAEAVACGRKTLDLHPYFALGRSHYAQALEFAGRFEEALVEYRLAGIMSPDLVRLKAEEARCLARSGRRSEAAAVLRSLEELRRTEYVDGYAMAFVYDALGRQEPALQELERAVEEGSPNLCIMDVDPRMDGLRGCPRFVRLRNRLFRSVPIRKTAAAPNAKPRLSAYAKESALGHWAAS